MAVFLVNLPFVHEALIDRAVASSGREVAATVLDGSRVSGRNFVDYRLPKAVDPEGTRFSARIDDETYARALESKVLPVRVVPGRPEANRPQGRVASHVFTVVALGADAVLALGAVFFWRRRRRWRLHHVVEVHQDTATLRFGAQTVTVTAPEPWLRRVQAGTRVPGSLHLVAEGDLLPEVPAEGLAQLVGARYLARGRVVDTRAGQVDLDVGEGLVLRVEVGPHRIRADLRDSTEVCGTLCFTPS